MGLRMFLLLGLALLIFTDHSQGIPETHEHSLTVSTVIDASDVGAPLATANPINTPTQHNRLCNCKGKGEEAVSARCPCQQAGRRRGKPGKLKALCQRRKYRNKKKCLLLAKQMRDVKNRKFEPSVPI